MIEPSFYYMKFEYIDAEGYHTIVEKHFPEVESEFTDLMYQLRYAIIACGFGKKLVDKYLPEDIG